MAHGKLLVEKILLVTFFFNIILLEICSQSFRPPGHQPSLGEKVECVELILHALGEQRESVIVPSLVYDEDDIYI